MFILRSYLRLIVFTLGLLVRVQMPGLIGDYSQRVQAHLSAWRRARPMRRSASVAARGYFA